jgi:hypothetical protein
VLLELQSNIDRLENCLSRPTDQYDTDAPSSGNYAYLTHVREESGMPVITGIFGNFADAQLAAMNITRKGIGLAGTNLLTPGTSEAELASVPTTDAEPPGVGKAFGGLLGGALAAAGGMQLGAAAASLVLPGVGPVLALGTAAAVLAGVGGAAGGAAFGEYLDQSATHGLPTDELYRYKDALRKGRSVLLVQTENEQQRDEVRAILAASGAESLDTARESWWIGLRDAEEAEYEGGEDFVLVETSYRLGFEAAQQVQLFGKRFEDALPYLEKRYSYELCRQPAFSLGYDRGKKHSESLQARYPPIEAL